MLLYDQLDALTEDQLQVESIDGNYLLDVGWYPEFSLKGSFKIMIIKKYDWDNPLFLKECLDIPTLKVTLCECISRYGF